jgi:methylated-DNA-[protein]-cysteine S-methyltransferase
MSDYVIDTISTPDGPFMILEDEQRRVVSSGWTGDLDRILGRLPAKIHPSNLRYGKAVSREAVDAYYRGETDAVLEVPVQQYGTDLFHEGWRQLRQIPAGTVLTYTALAQEMGRPKAIRVAGSVCGTNAPALFVPCHRVRRSDGTLGGFAWGLPVKAALLVREGIDLISSRGSLARSINIDS